MDCCGSGGRLVSFLCAFFCVSPPLYVSYLSRTPVACVRCFSSCLLMCADMPQHALCLCLITVFCL